MAWSCKSWDGAAFLAQALGDAAERHAVMYAAAFLPSEGDGLDLLAAGYSDGSIRVFDWRHASKLWLGSRQAGRDSLQWRAHEGGTYALTVIGEGPSAVLVSCGDDGRVRGWAVRDICGGVIQQQQQQPAAGGAAAHPARAPAAPPPALFDASVPRAELQFPIAAPARPAAQALAKDEARGLLFVGASDGGAHALDLLRLGELGSSSGGGSGGGVDAVASGALAASLQGHAAAVLGMDCCGATGQLATASEDATVRVWDPRAAAPCTTAVDASRGEAIPPYSRPDALRCLGSPHAPCVRFDAGGGWLVAGGGGGTLTMWSLGLGALAKQLDTGGCVPQALHMVPGEILMVGSEPALHRYRFSLEPGTKADLSCGAAFALDVHPGTGTIVAGGAKGAALLSQYGTRLGRIAA